MPTGSYNATQPSGTSAIKPAGYAWGSRGRRPGKTSHGAPAAGALAILGGQLGYHVYANTGAADPINYSSLVAATNGTTWSSSPLASPGTWSFGVRAFDGNGEEQNLDCAVTIVLDPLGNDITSRPMPPMGMRGFATAGGSVRVEWLYPAMIGPTAPTGFHIYCGTGGTPNYGSAAATVPFNAAILNTFVTNLALTGGTAYTIGVRAFNGTGEEQNTTTVTVTADATGPAPVDSLIATAIV